MSDHEQAEKLRAEGNAMYSKGKYSAAIDLYSNALLLRKDEKIYTNRALCHMKKEAWEACLSDGESAAAMNPKFVKAHYVRGAALLKMGRFEDAKGALDICVKLSESQSTPFTKEIETYLLQAKKGKWHQDAAQELNWVIDARKTLNSLLDKDREAAARGCESERAGKIHFADIATRVLVDAFDCYEDSLKVKTIPEHFMCPISMDIFSDPVITPAGHTYERDCLISHIDKNGAFDPVTREKFDKRQVFPNLGMKHAVKHFLNENPWAYEHI